MGMSMDIRGLGNFENLFLGFQSMFGDKTDEALKEFAEELKRELEATSPVDTGEYKGAWAIEEVDKNHVVVYNSAEHARFVGLPNRKMIGSSYADDPQEGILHDVEAIAYSQRSNMKSTVSDHLSSFLS